MSREACDLCTDVVSTTAEPSNKAGRFFTNAQLERLLAKEPWPALHEALELSIYMVICEACQAKRRKELGE